MRVCKNPQVQVLAHGPCGYLSILQDTPGGSLRVVSRTPCALHYPFPQLWVLAVLIEHGW